jgi:hypothetical protein
MSCDITRRKYSQDCGIKLSFIDQNLKLTPVVYALRKLFMNNMNIHRVFNRKFKVVTRLL